MEDERPSKKQKTNKSNDINEEDGEDDYYLQILNKKRQMKKAKKRGDPIIHEQAMVNSNDTSDGKRPIDEHVKRRGQLKQKKKTKSKSARVNYKEKYRKMQIRRRGQVPNMRVPTNKGEKHGINPKVVGSIKLG